MTSAAAERSAGESACASVQDKLAEQAQMILLDARCPVTAVKDI
ncbi:hypothetical protein ACQP1U_16110 [Actinomycetota bacterium]